MTERPIIFSGPMIRALLAGRKTQTRRICKAGDRVQNAFLDLCPYGKPGDQLWVRETFQLGSSPFAALRYIFRADGTESHHGWKPAIHMPRAACRLHLEVTGIRIERLFNISEADCRAEGMVQSSYGWTTDEGQPVSVSARRAFEDLWHSINGAWLDCWVWVVEFKGVK